MHARPSSASVILTSQRLACDNIWQDHCHEIGASSSGRSFVQDSMNFNGEDQWVEARPRGQVGGAGGLSIVARVRRSSEGGPAWDRLIDYGNGAEKENIVINFQQEMMYEVRGPDGRCHSLAVRASETSGHASSSSQDVKPGTWCAESEFPRNEWVHISLVHDSDGVASIFWDGRLKARGPVQLPSRVHRDNYYVGKSHWTHDPYFKGEISELHVFDYALSRGEITQCATARCLPTGALAALSEHSPSPF